MFGHALTVDGRQSHRSDGGDAKAVDSDSPTDTVMIIFYSRQETVMMQASPTKRRRIPSYKAEDDEAAKILSSMSNV